MKRTTYQQKRRMIKTRDVVSSFIIVLVASFLSIIKQYFFGIVYVLAGLIEDQEEDR